MWSVFLRGTQHHQFFIYKGSVGVGSELKATTPGTVRGEEKGKSSAAGRAVITLVGAF